MKLPHINRVEVIDHTGRAYSLRRDDAAVTLEIQDDGRTLKVFIHIPNELPVAPPRALIKTMLKRAVKVR